MWGALHNVYRLGIKELFSLAYDPVLLILIAYAFTLAIYTAATAENMDIQNASIAIVDEDGSVLSRRIAEGFFPPYFQRPQQIGISQVDDAMATGRFTFVVDIPSGFAADVLAGQRPTAQLLIDATAMSQAGRGAVYVQSIIADEVSRFVAPEGADVEPIALVVRSRFNPNLTASWFGGVMEVLNNVTLLALILTGAAVIREREHGTLEHLLAMPLRPSEIMLSKIWANGAVIVLGALLSLIVLVRGLLEIPIAGSLVLFAAGTSLYVASVASLGILLSTVARSMPQFGLLCIPTFMILNLLSGSYTPLESIPSALGVVMNLFPALHFVSFSKGVLFRGADLAAVSGDLALMALTGAVFFSLALVRFRRSVGIGGT